MIQSGMRSAIGMRELGSSKPNPGMIQARRSSTIASTTTTANSQRRKRVTITP
jgi:hypothetical protein